MLKPFCTFLRQIQKTLSRFPYSNFFELIFGYQPDYHSHYFCATTTNLFAFWSYGSPARLPQISTCRNPHCLSKSFNSTAEYNRSENLRSCCRPSLIRIHRLSTRLQSSLSFRSSKSMASSNSRQSLSRNTRAIASLPMISITNLPAGLSDACMFSSIFLLSSSSSKYPKEVNRFKTTSNASSLLKLLASASTNSTFRPSSFALALARPRYLGVLSTPVTSNPRRASSRLCLPTPQHRSQTLAPAYRSSNVKTCSTSSAAAVIRCCVNRTDSKVAQKSSCSYHGFSFVFRIIAPFQINNQ